MKFYLSLLLITLPQITWGLNCAVKSHQGIAREIQEEIEKNPFACNPQKVHLTFDDGPSGVTTSQILKELELRKVKATFFVTTTNLENSQREQNIQIINRALSEGHLIASHGHQHSAYDLRISPQGKVLEKGFTQAEREQQIHKSTSLLDAATNKKFSAQPLRLFRLPYGRGAAPSQAELNYLEEKGMMNFTSINYGERLKEYRQQSPALQTLSGSDYSHLGWNHDSKDSSHGAGMPDKKVLNKFILDNIKSLCAAKSTQVSLFHDIKLMNTVAIPVIVDIGQCLGLKFISAQEMMKDANALTRSGTLISKQTIAAGPVEIVNKILSEGLQSENCETKVEGTCFSQQYQRSYQECEGGDSVCYQGKWHARTDPLIILNCAGE